MRLILAALLISIPHLALACPTAAELAEGGAEPELAPVLPASKHRREGLTVPVGEDGRGPPEGPTSIELTGGVT